MLPCTTIRWKFATLYPGWTEDSFAQLTSPAADSVTHGAVGESGLSDR